MARPITTSYSDEAKAGIVDHVVTQLCTGRSINRILKEDDFMPSSAAFYGWLFGDAELMEKVERAREFGAAALIDEIVDIADHENKTDTNRAKLRVYAREKQAAMIAPRRYGPKLDLTSGRKALEAPEDE
jgi:hypothetical protein